MTQILGNHECTDLCQDARCAHKKNTHPATLFSKHLDLADVSDICYFCSGGFLLKIWGGQGGVDRGHGWGGHGHWGGGVDAPMLMRLRFVSG